jgi:hypothetical protein
VVEFLTDRAWSASTSMPPWTAGSPAGFSRWPPRSRPRSRSGSRVCVAAAPERAGPAGTPPSRAICARSLPRWPTGRPATSRCARSPPRTSPPSSSCWPGRPAS